ncbi:hypothetical protein CGRA01v4_08109 [Colletotrichum graminicola]|nr:hypothetical protein CGRA01v4_08109 [Colletotrichum graminicola]
MCCQWLGPFSRQPESISSIARYHFDASGMRAMT